VNKMTPHFKFARNTNEWAADIERQTMPAILANAVSSIDHQIIADGLKMGFLPSHVDVTADHPVNVDVLYLRFRAACARAERRMHYPYMAAYFNNRATQADTEANAMEASHG
jgi:hypothetical protein